MADSINYKDWYYKANQDFRAAKIFFDAEESSDNLDYSISAFHCQQCIEKYLKGYILKATNNLVDGHNLSRLCKLASESDSYFRRFKDDCDYVNDFYVEPRYPAEILIIKKHEAEECIKVTQKVTEYVLELEKD